LGTAGILAL